MKEQRTISVDGETADKLKALSEKTFISMSFLLRQWVDACTVVSKELDCEYFSMGSFPTTDKKKVVTLFAKLLVGKLDSSTLDENIDSEIKKKVEKEREKK